MSATELLADLQPVAEDERPRFDALLAVAEASLRSTRFTPLLRSFAPAEAPAVLLSGSDADHEADRRAVADGAEGAWMAALEAIGDLTAASGVEHGPTLVLNAANPTVRKLADSGDGLVQRLGVEAVYAHLLLSGRHLVRPADQVIVSRAIGELIERALDARRAD